jgi:hypothetical protein
VIVLDVNSGGTGARELATASRNRFGPTVPLVFAGTKIDSRIAPSLSNAEGLKLAKEFGPSSKYVDVSALKGTRCTLVVQSAVKLALAATPSEASKGDVPAAAAQPVASVTIKQSVFAPPPPPVTPPPDESSFVPPPPAGPSSPRVFKAPSKAALPPVATVKLAPFAAPPSAVSETPIESTAVAGSAAPRAVPVRAALKAAPLVATIKVAPFAPPTGALGGSVASDDRDTSSATAAVSVSTVANNPPLSRIAAAGRLLPLKKAGPSSGFAPPPPQPAALQAASARTKPFPVEEVIAAIPPKYVTEKLKEYLDTCLSLVKVWSICFVFIVFFFTIQKGV